MSISDFIMGIEDFEDVQRWKKMAKCFRPGDAAALSLFFMNEICPDQEEGRNCDLCGREAKDLCDLISRVQAAAEMAEGKIGPDTDAKPQVWQITEERKAALWHAINVLKENDIMEEPEEHLWDEEVTVLQAMLTEAGQE